jgi:hypothetical protein
MPSIFPRSRVTATIDDMRDRLSLPKVLAQAAPSTFPGPDRAPAAVLYTLRRRA